ncbi:hypothetical protein ACLB2K_023644 [Fragaria x ananassa]
MWRLLTLVEVQARGNRYFFTFTSERDVNHVKRGSHWAYQRAIILLNDYDGFSDITVVPLFCLDMGRYSSHVRVRVTLPLHQPVRLERRIRVSPDNVILVTYKYECLLGRCHTCAMINHGGDICPRENKEVPRPVANLTLTTATPAMVFKENSFQTLNTLTMLSLPPLFPKEKRSVQIREISTFPSPTKV